MYIKDDIVYAGEIEPMIHAVSVRPLEQYRLLLRFSTGESKIFDCKPLLDKPVFSTLKDISIFNAVYLEYGVPRWCDGMIDIAPEWLYEDSVSVAAPAEPLQ